MRMTAWKGGRFGKPSISYGIRIGKRNRRQYFRPCWKSVTVEIEGGSATEVTLTDGFWQDCPEIRDSAFREWFKARALIPWASGSPPVFELDPVGERRFKLSGPLP
jgi:hypothetical protein